MADNYLEKKMEDYRRRSDVGRRSSVTSVSSRTLIKMPVLKVFISGKIGPIEKNLIKGYTSFGSKVIFCHDNNNEGTLLAQETGGLFFPASKDGIHWTEAFDFAVERWCDLDVIVFNDSSLSPDSFGERLCGKRILSVNRTLSDLNSTNCMALTVPEDSENISSFVKMALFLSNPDNHCITRQTISFP